MAQHAGSKPVPVSARIGQGRKDQRVLSLPCAAANPAFADPDRGDPEWPAARRPRPCATAQVDPDRMGQARRGISSAGRRPIKLTYNDSTTSGEEDHVSEGDDE